MKQKQSVIQFIVACLNVCRERRTRVTEREVFRGAQISFFFFFSFSLNIMDSLFIKLSHLLGGHVAPDHLKLAFSILSTYPSAILFKHISSTSIKHVFSIIYTTFIMLSVLRLYDGYIHAFTISLFSYFFMKYTNSAWTNFIVVMASMCVW